jgi:hypothetical protein
MRYTQQRYWTPNLDPSRIARAMMDAGLATVPMSALADALTELGWRWTADELAFLASESTSEWLLFCSDLELMLALEGELLAW